MLVSGSIFENQNRVSLIKNAEEDGGNVEKEVELIAILAN